MIFEPASAPWPGRMLSLIRVVAGIMFISVGTMKMFNYPPAPVPMPPYSLVTEIGISSVLEVFGGTLIVIGLLTRPVAFVLAGEMAYAYFKYHAPNGFFPALNNGQPAILYCFLFLYLMLAGPGPWSVDAILARRRTKERP